jgi:hypothetical protein
MGFREKAGGKVSDYSCKCAQLHFWLGAQFSIDPGAGRVAYFNPAIVHKGAFAKMRCCT